MSSERMYSTMRLYTCLIAPALILAMILSACAEKGPILLTVNYQAPEEIKGPASKITVGVSPLKDSRGMAAATVGKRTIPDGQVNSFVVQRTAAEITTVILKEALTARGFTVKDIPAWDLTADSITADNGSLLLGGEIKTLWLESSASSFQTHVKASVQLKIVAGDTAEKKVFRTIEVNSKLDEDTLYSPERLEHALSEAISSAMDQIFKDDEMKKRLQ